MANENISAYHLSTRPDLYEPQRENSFMFYINGIDDILRAGAVGDEDYAKIANASEIMKFSVVSWSGGMTYQQDEVPIQLGNSTIYFAGKPTFSTGSLVINDYIGADNKSILQAWQNLSYNLQQDTVSSLNITNYKKTCFLTEFTPEMREVRTYKLEGCWVTNLDFGNYTYESQGKKTVTATIRYDKCYQDLSGGVAKPLGTATTA